MLEAEMPATITQDTPSPRHRFVAPLAAAILLAALAGCSASPSANASRGHAPEQTWDGYLPTLAVSANPASASAYHLERARRDTSLGVRSDVLQTPAMYPPEDRPTLDHPRRYWFPTSPNSYTYFRSESEVRTDRRWRWGY